LHIAPPSKAEQIEVESVRVDYQQTEAKNDSDAEGSESSFEADAEGENVQKAGALLSAGNEDEYRER
jgi:hypothetical protein